MTILILTGPPAAGKNTVAEVLAGLRSRCAVIDVDLVRSMLRQPHKAPWQGEEGIRQQRLGIRNACTLAQAFIADGADVVILDVLSDETARLYKHQFADAKLVLLSPSYPELHKRFLSRHASITQAEFDMLYREAENFSAYDEKIDNTDLSATEVAEMMCNFLERI